MIGEEVYRTDDGGKTWRKVNEKNPVGGGPGYYYMDIRIDPADANHAYVLSVGVLETKDGGKTWTSAFRFGGDNHALWIDPKNSKHMLLGYDHGMGITFDGGQNWYHPDELPLAQFYAVGLDNKVPYNVYGGLQDNGSVRGPSSKRGGRPIVFEDWQTVGGGDGFYNVVDLTDRYLYNESQFGSLSRTGPLHGRIEAHHQPRPVAAFQLELADRRVAARPDGGLPRGQPPDEVHDARRHLGVRQPRSHDQRQVEDADRQGRRRQHPVLHDHDRVRVADRPRPPLGRHRRRKRVGDEGRRAQRRQELDEAERQHQGEPGLLGERRRGVAPLPGHGVRELHRATGTTTSGRSSTRRPTTARRGRRLSATCPTRRSTSSARIRRTRTCCSSARISASTSRLTAARRGPR